MAGARNDVEKLGQRVEKVDHLGNEEEKHCLAEVPKDAHHGKGHASKIAEGVSHKHTGRVPAVRQERKQMWQFSKDLPTEGRKKHYP